MDRREFLKTTGAAAAAATSATAAVAGSGAADPLASPAIASGAKELRLVMPWPDNGQGYGDSGRRLARRIESLSEGRYRVVIAVGSIAAGEGDLVHGTAHDQASQHAAFAYFAGLPGETGLSPVDLEAWVSVGGGQNLWDDLSRDLGFKPLLAGHSGAAPALWSRQALTGVSDFAGTKVFALGLGADVARALGAEPVSLSSSQVGKALAEGNVRFAEWGGALQSLALGLQRVAAHASGSGLNGNGTALSLSVRLPVWEAMSETARAVLRTASTEEYRACVAESRAHETIVRRAVSEANGVVFSAFPADVTDAISRVADATIAHVAARDERAARIDQSYMSFRGAMGGTGSRSNFTS